MAPPPTGAAAAGGAAAPSPADRARALEFFEHLLNAATLKHILGYHREMCQLLGARPGPLTTFYPRVKAGLEVSWRAKALWKRLDMRAAHKCYGKGRAAAGTRVLIVGGGPCGLRTAIEAQLLGAKVVVVEKRDRFSRNNVLHLWPFVIEDLRALGAKKFFGRFCAGAIDHISIRQIQCILLKAALLLGVEVHAEVGFEGLVEPDPNQKTGWRGKFSPAHHPVSQYEFDVVIGADGKRNTLQGFKRKEFRGKLAIAITANFINKKTEAEARVEEISGVAFIFNQKFFKDLQEETKIDLENIVYYKDDTHYFVMTAKKASLLEKGVIKQDLADTEKLLAPENVDRDALQNYAREAADFSTNYQMPDLEFAVNHYNQPDVAMFDFTSMYAAEYASRVLERNGHRLLMILVGDSLLEPFWPTGSGCARGFLSSLDAAWAIRSWSMGTLTPLDVLAERESIYRLLAQTTPDNLNKDWKSYTLDPSTRYPNLNKTVVLPHQTVFLYDADNPESIEKMKRISHEPIVHEVPKKRRRGNVDNEVLLSWLAEQLANQEDIAVTDLSSVYKSGKPLCAIIHHYRPDLLDYSAVIDDDPAKNNQLAFEVFEKELGIVPIMTGDESVVTEDYLTMASYLTQIYDTFRGEIPHVKHPKLPLLSKMKSKIPKSLNPTIPLEHTSSDSKIEEKIICKKCGGTGVKKCKIVRLKKRKTESFLNTEFNKSVESVFSQFDLGENGKNCSLKHYKKCLYIDKSSGDKNGTINEEISVVAKKILHKRKKTKEQRSVLTPIPEKVDEKIQSSENLIVASEQTFIVESKSEIFDDRLENCTKKNIQKDFNVFRCEISNIDDLPLPKVPSQNNFYSGDYDDIIVEERTDIIKCESPKTSSDENICELKRFLTEKKDVAFPKYRKPFRVEKIKSSSEPLPQCSQYSSIMENEENELPESNKRSEASLKMLKTIQPVVATVIPASRPSSRHKRHVDAVPPKPYSVDKKTRKRRTLERLGSSVGERQKVIEDIAANRADRQNKRRQQRKYQTEQFLKSMQMLQANAKPGEPEPFEDYSIFLYRQTAPKFEDRVKDWEKQFVYVPDHESKSNVPRERRGSTAADEDIAAKIKNLENKWSNPTPVEKKPKHLLRAIGKIDNSDWNIKEIEKKIMENKMGKPSSQNKDKEKVPKWSKEQFLARQTKMESKHLDRQDSAEAKFADIDKNIKFLDLKLKEGMARDLGQNKVASITEKLTSKVSNETKPVEKTGQKPALPGQNASEFCHFCGKRVYLMERLSAEGRFFHHGCFKCQYCHTQLRLGSYTFDRDGTFGYKFFCMHHYGMQGEMPRGKVSRKPSQRKSPVKKPLPGVSGVDLLDRVQTPERIEFSNLSNVSSDHDDALSQMDEDEWTDKNFGPSCPELDESDEDSSSVSDTDSDDEEAYDDAVEEPATKEGTMKWAERWKNSYSRKHHRGSESDGYSSSDRSSYYENSSDDSDSDTATEGEEEIRQRELRKQEVRVEPPVVQTDTGTETEIVSDETTSESSSEVHNSATEISTDSEFAQDDPTPTRELPTIALNDFNVTKTRGSGRPRKIQVTSGYIQKAKNTTAAVAPKVTAVKLPVKRAAPAPFEGYALNRTQSTGGIAAKVSLELKKKYLLGEGTAGSIQKSGSASALDNKFKSFQSTISDCQKLLKPAAEISPGMQVFCSKLKELPPPDVTITTITENKEEKIEANVFQNEPEGRPRSPVHETSIAVPKIDWNKNKSQSSDSLSISSSENEPPTTPNFHIPRLEVTEDNIAPDSLIIEETKTVESRASNHSITSEKKELNQPKELPKLENILPEVHDELHVKKNDSPKSGKSSPEVTAALTETELSDWARDGAVSEDDLEFELSDDKKKKAAKITELDNKTIITEATSNILSENLDSIEFMDTGTETSSEGVVDSQNGYVLFKNEDEITEDSLDPNINQVVEVKNDNVVPKTENTGFCVIADENNKFGSEVIDIKPSDLEKMKQKLQNMEHEEDSLLIIEKDTTTEENTCSDSTVKNVTEIGTDTKLAEQMHKQRLEKKLSDLKEQKANEISPTVEFETHCQRLESKVDFGNAKDSIDIKKTRRKSRSEQTIKPDLIQEESNSPLSQKEITLDLSPVIRTPDILYKRENIKKERDINQKLIQEMVLNKMRAENKSLERKKRIRSPYEVSKSSNLDVGSKNRPLSAYATPDLLSNSIPLQNSQSVINVPDSKNFTPVRPLSVFSETKNYPNTTLSSLENASMPDIRKNLFGDDFKTPVAPPRQNRNSDVTKTAEKMKENARARVRLLSNEDLGLSPEDKLLKLKEKVRKGREIENANPHIQESIESLVLNTERRNSILYSNDTLTKKKNRSFRRSKSGESSTPKLSAFNDDITRTKSITEIARNAQEKKLKLACKSDPNLLDTDAAKPKKKIKDRERRRSITKLLANIFTRKSPTNGGRGIFSKLSPKSKGISKSCVNLGSRGAEPVIQEQIRRKSFSELSIQMGENSPPPIPPLPLNYTGSSVHATDDSSDGENQWKNKEHGSCDTLDQSGGLDNSNLSLSGRRSGKSARKAARQAQLKRHRMAQEIQRKLEETEVKTRELEQRGVSVEKALRGEDSGENSRDESELLQEWFDLMRDRTELRRYEKELMVRAQELELEDRHARLQHELRERLETNESKTQQDVEAEEQIINEMMEIVSRRDTLLLVLEEEKLRYSNEDRDLEEQMLAKGLRLTPIIKTPEK